jgi:hypothetical protein
MFHPSLENIILCQTLWLMLFSFESINILLLGFFTIVWVIVGKFYVSEILVIWLLRLAFCMWVTLVLFLLFLAFFFLLLLAILVNTGRRWVFSKNVNRFSNSLFSKGEMNYNPNSYWVCFFYWANPMRSFIFWEY